MCLVSSRQRIKCCGCKGLRPAVRERLIGRGHLRVRGKRGRSRLRAGAEVEWPRSRALPLAGCKRREQTRLKLRRETIEGLFHLISHLIKVDNYSPINWLLPLSRSDHRTIGLVGKCLSILQTQPHFTKQTCDFYFFYFFFLIFKHNGCFNSHRLLFASSSCLFSDG